MAPRPPPFPPVLLLLFCLASLLPSALAGCGSYVSVNGIARTAKFCDKDCLRRGFGVEACDMHTAKPAYYAAPFEDGEAEEKRLPVNDFCQSKRSLLYTDQICCPLSDAPDHVCAMKTLTCFVDEELLPNEIQNDAGTLTWKDFKVDVNAGVVKRTHPVYLEVHRGRLGEVRWRRGGRRGVEDRIGFVSP